MPVHPTPDITLRLRDCGSSLANEAAEVIMGLRAQLTEMRLDQDTTLESLVEKFKPKAIEYTPKAGNLSIKYRLEL